MPTRLTVGDSGDDVARLHERLELHGTTISDEERARRFFGPSTRQAVREIQKTHGIEPSGDVGEKTAAVLDSQPPTGGSPVGAKVVADAGAAPAEAAFSRPRLASPDAGGPQAARFSRETAAPSTRLTEAGPEDGERSFVVQGRVTFGDGRPARDTSVRVAVVGLRSQDLLGEARTDAEGRYELHYKPDQFQPAATRGASLLVSVYGDGGLEIATSPIIFNAQASETVDINLGGEYRAPSEYEQLIAGLSPALQGVPLHELTEANVTFLASMTGLDRQRITWLAESARHAQETGIPPEAFYGWFRQNLPANLPDLLKQRPDAQRRALEAAVRGNIIPAGFGSELDAVLAHVQRLAVDSLLEQGNANGKASLGDLLNLALPDQPDKRRTLATLYIDHQGNTEAFRSTLRETSSVDNAESAQVESVLRLAELANHHLPLVRKLHRMGVDDSAFAELRGFARLDEADWQALLQRPQADDGQPIGCPPDTPGENDQEKIANYARMLSQFIADRFPTAVIAGRLEKEPRDDSPFEPLKADLKAFFANNPEFEFRDTPIQLYLSEDGNGRLKDVANPEDLKAQLKSMQRVFKITPRYERMRALLADDLHSSQAIVHLGEREFVERHAATFGGEEAARVAYRQAEDVHLMALMLFAKYSDAFNSPLPYALVKERAATDAPTDDSSVVKSDWRMLFGSLDLCDCRHCSSLYSPAAYLVDILEFLKNGPKTNDQTPLDVLLDRRPDIASTELTCKNTDTTMPYVDLVNEVLESAIAPQQQTIVVPSGHAQATVTELNSGRLPTWLKDESSGIKPPISSEPSIRVINQGTKWLVNDDGRRRTVLYEGGSQELVIADDRDQIIKTWSGFSDSGAIDALDNRQIPGLLATYAPAESHVPGKLTTAVDVVLRGLSWHITYERQWTITAGEDEEEGAWYGVIGSPGAVEVIRSNGRSFDGDLNSGRIPRQMKHWFATSLYDDPKLMVTPRPGGNEWQVIKKDKRYIRYSQDWLQVSFTLQTSGISSELLANPEHTNIWAYEELSQALYPWNLPYDLGWEEARAYLQHLGVERHELMKTMRSAVDATTTAQEHLGLTGWDWKIITGQTGQEQEGWRFWGFPGQNGPVSDPQDRTKTVTDNWISALMRVDVFLQQSGLIYKELLELLGMYFVNPVKGAARTLSLVADEGADAATCQLDKLRIKGLDAAILGKMHRFVRLSRKLGWTMRDLDKAIKAQNRSDLDDLFLVELSHIQRLSVNLNVPVAKAVSWIGSAKIDTAEYIDQFAAGQPPVKSLYEQTFLNKAVTNPVDAAFELNSARTELRNFAPTITEHSRAVMAALGIGAADLSLLVDKTWVHDDMRLENLSKLYRISSLAKALKLSIRDWYTVRKLTAIDPFGGGQETLRFVEKVHTIRASGFSIGELDYLLRHHFTPLSGVAPAEGAIAATLGEIRRELQKIAAENRFREAPSDDLAREKLASLGWDPALVDEVVATLDGSVTYEAMTNTFLAGLKLENDTGVYEEHWVDPSPDPSDPVKITLPSDLDGIVTVTEVKELFTCDGTIPVTSGFFGGVVSIELTAVFSEHGVNIGFMGVEEVQLDKLWTIDNRYSVKRIEDKLHIYDLRRTIRALRVLNSVERDKLTEFAAGLKNAEFVKATRQLLTGQDKLQGHITYEQVTVNGRSKGRLHFTGLMSPARKHNLEAASDDSSYREAIEACYLAPRTFLSSHREHLTFLVWVQYEGQPDDISAMLDVPHHHESEKDPLDNPLTSEDRFRIVLDRLSRHIQRTLAEPMVVQKIAEALKLEVDTADKLLTTLRSPIPIHAASKAIAEFVPTSPGFSASLFVESNPSIPVTEVAFSDQFKTFKLLHKCSMLITKLNITQKQLVWLFEYGPDLYNPNDPDRNVDWLDLNRLPLEPPISASGSFSGWERLIDLFRLRDQLPLGESVLADVFRMARTTPLPVNFAEELSSLTGWSLDNLNDLIGNEGLGLKFPDAFKDERALARLLACMKMVARLGASAKEVSEWAQLSQNAVAELAKARSIKRAVKARYDSQQWLSVAQTLRNPLREKQRSALVAYLTTRPDSEGRRQWRDSNELYEHFLIDVEMDACMMTTRIKQAISSVQLFIQRCLMNLEPAVALTSGGAQEWRIWRKQYRVWEANRKVFLYPENWIEPELRDDKSPFFKDLENELLQNDVTMDTAETAFLNYLEKLDEVARLEIVGMYQQTDDGVDILHVFGRTYSSPHIYYYRKHEKHVWSAWEKVDLDIEGDHLVPMVWNRRLNLFWPVFTEKARPLDTEELKGPEFRQMLDNEKKEVIGFKSISTPPAPKKYWEIQIAWSEYRNGKWSTKRVSPDAVEYEAFELTDNPKTFIFRGRTSGDWAIIDCYGRVRSGEPPQESPMPPQDEDLTYEPYSPKEGMFLGTTTISGTLYDTTNFNQPIRNGTVELIKNGKVVRSCPVTDGSYSFSGWRSRTRQESLGYQLKATVSTDYAQCYPPNGANATVTIAKDGGQYVRSFGFTQKVMVPLVKTGLIGSFWSGCSGDIRRSSQNGETSDIGFIELWPDAHFESAMLVENETRRKIEGNKVDDRLYLDRDRREEQILLNKTPGRFRLLIGHQFENPYPQLKYFFFQDDRRTYYVALTEEGGGSYRDFTIFYHPWVTAFVHKTIQDGLSGLLTRSSQQKSTAEFDERYGLNATTVRTPVPVEDVDFRYNGAYALYNWELFFHAPFLVATRLSSNQRFEEAQKWFHYIFDPTSSEPGGPERFWKVKPFYEEAASAVQTIDQLMADTTKLNEQIAVWKENPFKPHAVARLRAVAYMKAVVMRYIDNLIAWGDQLFRRDTIESINEATQLYILAAQILGRRPEEIPARATPTAHTYHTLNTTKRLNELGNWEVEIESFLFPSSAASGASGGGASLGKMAYFGIPKNDKLLGYWDMVADRLFKIRHCMNIEGVVRQLPIFEPPIDPALLVRAAAAGVDLSSVLGDINAASPHYRFNVMLQKATELCNDVKALGAALLAALEKRDGEALALLRSGHEIKLLSAVRDIKQKQITEAQESLEGLRKSKLVIEERYNYYKDIARTNTKEELHATELRVAHDWQIAGQSFALAASVAHMLPDLTLGTSGYAGSPVTTLRYGGTNIGNALSATSKVMDFIAFLHTHKATMASIQGGYDRRWEDWKLQERLAKKELDQIDKQIAAAEIRHAIAENELKNHDLQVENAKEADAFMRDKYTNQELYSWMVGQLSGLYFQSYQMAYDIAKRAERAYRHELGLADSNFVQFGYWVSLKQGLLAGEKLHYDLKRMDVAYLDQNKREYEITKHVSLVLHDPLALITLKETGTCEIELPETVFDADYPGHYMRRIKSASLTIPCVVGPYTSINCTLTLLSAKTRTKTTPARPYRENEEGVEERFVASFGTLQSIATSHAQNDSGMFELNFRDERFLPFEGAGAISRWRIELPKDTNAFDFNTLSDVVLHLKYTAREGGEMLKREARDAMAQAIKDADKTALARLFSAKHEFPTEWYQFLNPAPGGSIVQTLVLGLTPERFPFQFRGGEIEIHAAHVFLKLKDKYATKYDDASPLEFRLQTQPTPEAEPSQFKIAGSPVKDLPYAKAFEGQAQSPGEWSITIDVGKLPAALCQTVTIGGVETKRLNPDAIEDIWLVCQYGLE